jgi:hypothetical protein
MNILTDVDSGGDRGKKVVAVVVNNLGREKPRLTRLTIFLCIEGS